MDFEEENKKNLEDEIDLENIADLENELFADKSDLPKEMPRCENSKILPRKPTKGTILVLKPEESALNSSILSISNLDNTLNKKALMSSQGADSANMQDCNYAAPDSARHYSGAKAG